jgi:hypothetical protein
MQACAGTGLQVAQQNYRDLAAGVSRSPGRRCLARYSAGHTVILRICQLRATQDASGGSQMMLHGICCVPRGRAYTKERAHPAVGCAGSVPTAGGCRAAERYLSEHSGPSGRSDPEGYYMHGILRDVAILEARNKSSGCLYEVDQVRLRACAVQSIPGKGLEHSLD